MKTKIIGLSLLALAAVIFIVVYYKNNPSRQVPIVFSPRTMLAGLWHDYTETILEEGTRRTLDADRGYITTSEGQSYTMLRAVWMDDKDTFDTSWKWTNDILKREEDNLFSWLFGEKSDGTYGVVTEQGGYNTASDADIDIALALLFAYNRWGDRTYFDSAMGIIPDIWEKEVVIIKDRPYLAANNLEKESASDWIIVNPSYFAPYAYRVFAQVDPAHPWTELVDTSYELIQKSVTAPLNTGRGDLPPDWIRVNKTTGELSAPTLPNLPTTYSFDALRIPFRLALDYAWYGEERARETLRTMDFLQTEWQTKNILYAGYSHDGKATASFESPAMYAGSLGYFIVTSPDIAQTIYKTKLESLYNPDTQSWKERQGYYNANLVWFALALYNDSLPNLAATVTLPE
jgi:endoglucanase